MRLGLSMPHFYSILLIIRRLIGSRIIESANHRNNKLLVSLFLSNMQNTVNWISRLLLSLLYWPEVILLSGGHCYYINTQEIVFRAKCKTSGPIVAVVTAAHLDCMINGWRKRERESEREWSCWVIKQQHNRK